MFGPLIERNTRKRYAIIYDLIRENRCRRLMEIGTYYGVHAKEMIEVAQRNGTVEYYGFDLFEDQSEQDFVHEFMPKREPPRYSEVNASLEKTGASIKLFKGNTRAVLPAIAPSLPMMDFIYIDGGHSIETVENDWHYARGLMHNSTIVVFDDYYTKRMDIGCKMVIDLLPRSEFSVSLRPDDFGLFSEVGFRGTKLAVVRNA